MSMNIPSVASYNTSANVPDKGTSGSIVKSPEAKLDRVTTVDALQKLELQGERITAGDEQMIKKLDRIFKAIQGPNTSFEMSMHKETNTVMIKVMNKDTGELIREIPPEKTLDLVAKFMEINGILIDEKV
jgi:flagellar protein FlaG